MKIRAGLIINKYTQRVCHNTDCKKPYLKTETYSVCSVCKYTEYCCTICQLQHWDKKHKYECKAIAEVNFVESLIINSRCPQNIRHGLHKHPTIKNDKITSTKAQIIYQIQRLATKDTPLSCCCRGKISTSGVLIAPSYMLEHIDCLNVNYVHVYIRCRNNHCPQNKKAVPLFTLCPLSSAEKVFIVIPNQKTPPESLEFINVDSKNITKTIPEDCDSIVIDTQNKYTCLCCEKIHILPKMVGTNSNEHDNNNTVYCFNDEKDLWEIFI